MMYSLNNIDMRNELIADYTLINEYPSMNEKKALAAKYGIESKKAKEIERAILIAARDERKTRNTFDENDLRFFSNLEIPERYNNAVEYYSQESVEFLYFLKAKYYEGLVKRKLTNKLANPRSWGISIADRYHINRYNNVVKYLDEINPDTIKRTNEATSIEDEIKNILNSELKDFYATYISSVIDWASKQFDKNLKSYRSFQELSNNYDDITKIKGYKKYLKLKSFFVRFKTKDNFVDDVRKTAENKYTATINDLAKRIRTKKLNHKNITVKRVEDDPKLFEMLITDGEITMHARSIWCAEYSDIVTPHYRFIIT